PEQHIQQRPECSGPRKHAVHVHRRRTLTRQDPRKFTTTSGRVSVKDLRSPRPRQPLVHGKPVVRSCFAQIAAGGQHLHITGCCQQLRQIHDTADRTTGAIARSEPVGTDQQ
ncbi:MAG: hypothetical protein ACK56I_29555, partial [bacterium]